MARFLPVIGSLAFGLLVFALLPQGIIALNDEFGYLRSVVATLQHGRPWTDDWLEPWSAGLSILSALLFKGIGSFYFATYGLLAVLAASSFFATTCLLRARGMTVARSLVLGLVGLTFPTVLWKEVQFTGLALYLPCLLGALWAAERRRWGIFFVAWVLAFSTRQSALAWGALPVGAVCVDWWLDRRLAPRQWLGPVVVLAVGLTAFVALVRLMNKTLAQRLITDRMWSDWHWAQAWPVAVGGLICVALAAGWAVWAHANFPDGTTRGPTWRRGLAVLGLLAGGALLCVNARDYVAVEFDSFDSRVGLAVLKLLIAFGAVGLAFGRFAWRPLPLAGAAAAVAVLSFRATLWDYYLIDAGVFGFFAVTAVHPRAAPSVRVKWTSLGAVTALALFQFFALLQAKGTLDRTHALFAMGSRAIEGGKIPPNHASFLPFGLMGWYYFPLFAQRMEPGDADLADFGRYLEQDSVLVAWRYSRRLRSLPGHDGELPADHSREISQGKFNYCWLYGVEVVLLWGPPENVRPAKRPYPAGYRPPTFPSNDAGWRALIAGETRLAVP